MGVVSSKRIYPRRPYKPRNNFRYCINEVCRKPYRAKAAVKDKPSSQGYCPRCVALIKKHDGKSLDAKLYAECQKIARAEKRLPHSELGKAEADRKRLARLAKSKPKVPLLAALAYLSDGYVPTADDHKRGGPSGKTP